MQEKIYPNFLLENSVIFFANNSKKIAQEFIDIFGLEAGKLEISKFRDGEIKVEVLSDVRNKNVIFFHSMLPNSSDSLIEIALIARALKEESASSITAVIPYLAYGRQDRKTGRGQPIGAKAIALMLSSVGINKIITIDMHDTRVVGFFDINLINFGVTKLIAGYIEKEYKNYTLVAPDIGAIKNLQKIQKLLSVNNIAVLVKNRPKDGFSEITHIMGDVQGKECIIVDDMIDGGGTLINAVDVLLARGAKTVDAFITHGIFSGNAIEKIENSKINKLFVSNTISWQAKNSKKISSFSVTSIIVDYFKK